MPFNYKKYKDAQNTPLPAREQSPIKAWGAIGNVIIKGLGALTAYDTAKDVKEKKSGGANVVERTINAIDDNFLLGLGQNLWNTYAPVYKSEFKKYKDQVKKLHKK